MPHIKEIIDLLPRLDHKSRELITKAYHFADKAHGGIKRKSGEPYFNHVFATAKNLAELGMSPIMIAAGFLHDVLEDTKVTEKELTDEFGEEIVGLVNGVTKLGTVKYKGVERNVENLRKFFVAMAEDLRVIVIKLTDRLHNVQTLQHVRPDKQRRIALETLEIYAPLSDRLGMGKLKGRLEDAAFPFAYPKECEDVKKLLLERKDANVKYLVEVENMLKEKLAEHKIKAVSFDHRVKHLYSLWKKLKKHDMDIDKVYDITALRVIVKTIEDCYHVLGIVHGTWKPLPGKIKDYIALPKPNGYKSLHTTIFTGTGGIVEIQIRTEEMHYEAEYGIAAHFAYKEKIKLDDDGLERQYEWLKHLSDTQEKIKDTDKFFESLRVDFFKDRVFAFTPKGDIIDLPEDSSAIDFAYNVHSDIGNHAAGAKINGKFMALTTKLKSGDIVEVVVRKDVNPNAKWLDAVKTNVARSHIHRYVKAHSLLDRFAKFLGKK